MRSKGLSNHFSQVCAKMVAGWLFVMQPWSMAVRELAIPRHCYVPFPNLYLVIADAPSQTVLVAIAASLKMS